MGLKENIKQKRLENNMTLEELSVKVGVSRQTIQRYESGTISNIPSDKIELMANALETTPSYLMGWEFDKLRIESFGVTLENLLKSKGISIEELSNKTALQKSTLLRIMRTKSSEATAIEFSKVAIALDVDITELLNADSMHPLDYYECISTYERMLYGEIKEYFKILNDSGRKKTIDYARDISLNPAYRNNIDNDVFVDSVESDLNHLNERSQSK